MRRRRSSCSRRGRSMKSSGMPPNRHTPLTYLRRYSRYSRLDAVVDVFCTIPTLFSRP